MSLSLSGSGDVVTGPRGGDALTRGGPARARTFYLVKAQRALKGVMDSAGEGPGDETSARAGGSREDDAKVVAAYEWGNDLSTE